MKLQELIRKNPTEENLQRLKELIHNDILGSIKANLLVGNITEDDASQLRELTILLYEHICQHYEELGGLEDMKPLLEGAIELPLDKYRIRIDELEKEVAKTTKEKDKEISELKARIKELEGK